MPSCDLNVQGGADRFRLGRQFLQLPLLTVRGQKKCEEDRHRLRAGGCYIIGGRMYPVKGDILTGAGYRIRGKKHNFTPAGCQNGAVFPQTCAKYDFIPSGFQLS